MREEYVQVLKRYDNIIEDWSVNHCIIRCTLKNQKENHGHTVKLLCDIETCLKNDNIPPYLVEISPIIKMRPYSFSGTCDTQ